MDTNRLQFWWILLVIPFLIGCPFGEEPCPFNDWERITTIEGLIVIDPLRDTLYLDEVVTFKLTVPDSVFIFDTQLSLLEETGDQFPKLITDNRLFLNNTLDFEYGYQGEKDNWFHLEYNSETKDYTLKIEVKLSNVGNFELANASSRIIFMGENKCDWYEVRTNVKGFQDLGHWVKYTVIP